MAQFAFELVSPERRLISAEVDAVIVPGSEGEFTVLAGHAPFMSTLKGGIVTVENGGETSKVMVYGGFAEAGPEGLTILAEKAVNLKDVDRAALDQDIADLQDDVKDATSEDARARAQTKLDQMLALRAQIQ